MAIYYTQVLNVKSFLSPVFIAFGMETELKYNGEPLKNTENIYMNIGEISELVILIMHFFNTYLKLIITLIWIQAKY